jgi:hypothetical protein
MIPLMPHVLSIAFWTCSAALVHRGIESRGRQSLQPILSAKTRLAVEDKSTKRYRSYSGFAMAYNWHLHAYSREFPKIGTRPINRLRPLLSHEWGIGF